ncbi:MAG: PAS domain S-box protein, partial [Leptospiraceae bacterium]|nr:PAS domain S-box protein [Leptospiraceae bacterium]
GKTVRESLGPEFGLLFENGVQSVLESNKIVTIEYYSPDGRDFYQAQLNLVVIQGEKMVSCLVRDITKRKLSEKALLESEEKFRVLTETANDAIITVNQKGIVLEWNNGAENLFGFSKSEVINESMHIFMPDDFIPLHEKGMERYLNTGVNNVIGKTVELTGKKKNGTLFPLELSTSSYFIGGEELFTGIIRDISQHKQFVEDLKKAKNQAELANIAKSEFISNMSHEIRTPMNSILGFSEILNQNLEDPALKYYSESIATSGKILLTLINDILDLSKIESGKLEIQNQKINIIEIINEMKLIFSNKFKEKNLEFKINIDKLFPSGILIDGVRTRQILLNLIGNAVKFTESGSVSIHLTDLKISKSKDLLDFVLIIEDTGIGISEDDQRHIFEAFSQAKKQNIEKYGGTGLGLAIVKKLVTLMGGVITIKSILGKGSSFYILFKNIRIVENSFTVREEARVDLKKKINFEPSKILMVDDNQLNRKLIVKYLSKFPELGVIEAENGLEAVQFASEIEFDLILMDMKMPVMDGYEAAKLIREKNIKIPIVAITASVFQETRSSILKVCDDFLPKPINESSVLKIISTYIKVIDSNQPQDRKEDEKKVKEYSIEELNKFKSLHKILKEEKLQKSKELIEYNAIFEIKEFGEDLLVLGEEYKFDELIKMSKDMLNYANLFDMEKLTLELKEFPNLIDTLENLINEE